ncbi:MAG: hypothetical protein ACPKPY_06345 [Nitrososphaeraceae archaeon]
MEILSDAILAKHLFKKYSSNPRGWNFLISTTPIRDSFFDAIVSNSNEMWQLKIDSIYKPTPIVMGTKIDSDYSKFEKRLNNKSNVTPFGYRKLEQNTIMKFLKQLSDEQQNTSLKEVDVNNHLNTLLSSIKPVKPTKGHNYLYGPFIFTEKNLSKIDRSQNVISEKLSSKMRSNLRKRYSLYS